MSGDAELSAIEAACSCRWRVGSIASASSLAALLAFVLVNLVYGAVVVLRRSEPKLKRPCRVPPALGGIPAAADRG